MRSERVGESNNQVHGAGTIVENSEGRKSSKQSATAGQRYGFIDCGERVVGREGLYCGCARTVEDRLPEQAQDGMGLCMRIAN